eukprot:CAMPEP_0172519262 /NCGR_PEP_ID=MMETSP1066-20121228/291315_1 /TAXON_ID=671091 /ORGANISM="Coscinodiscus wailesii, Strain CCMP2513" /LENGTH=79 /DNA_ID=CAMNT_0013301819 /DNA_START=161 /DNA_END=400 /DNA_ORIENTATION=+
MTLQGKDDPDIPIATAIPAKPNGTTDVQESNIPAGHSRFYCSKCHAPYDLPDRCTTWRCANCSEFNSTTPGECPMCTIM